MGATALQEGGGVKGAVGWRLTPASFKRTLALPEEVGHWPLTTLRRKLGNSGPGPFVMAGPSPSRRRRPPYPALCSGISRNGATECGERPRRWTERGKNEMTEGEVPGSCINGRTAAANATQRHTQRGRAPAVQKSAFSAKTRDHVCTMKPVWLSSEPSSGVIRGRSV